jgi:dihydroorotate dehydrogenase
MNLYESVIRPLMFRLEAEQAHDLTLRGLRLAARALPNPAPDDYILAIEVLGLKFSNPFGLAAGFDKNAEVYNAMYKLGFGFSEVGTLTPQAQIGNPIPRIFRLPDHEAVINRLGFNNGGQVNAVERLRETPKRGLVGVNIGANKTATDRIADYVTGAARFKDLCDYLTINISSPNTPGLRDLQASAQLDELLERVMAVHLSCPVLVKIAPDIADEDIADIIAIAKKHRIAGLIVSNTTINRDGLVGETMASEQGGLSGRPLFQRSTDLLREISSQAGKDLVLIGVGGIASGDDAYEKILAGASLIQLYTAMIYQGPWAIKVMKRDLRDRLRVDGFARLADAVGAKK